MQHRNAPLTLHGRRRLVALVEEEQLTFEVAAAASNVSRSTAIPGSGVGGRPARVNGATFPFAYPAYRSQTKMLIPFVL